MHLKLLISYTTAPQLESSAQSAVLIPSLLKWSNRASPPLSRHDGVKTGQAKHPGMGKGRQHN